MLKAFKKNVFIVSGRSKQWNLDIIVSKQALSACDLAK